MSYSEKNYFNSSPSICDVQLPLANKTFHKRTYARLGGLLYLELGFGITMTVQKCSFMNERL